MPENTEETPVVVTQEETPEAPVENKISVIEEKRQEAMLRKTELVSTSNTGFIDPIVYAQMKQVATDFIESRAVPKGIENAAQLIMIFQAGYEMGMKPVEAMNGLYIVNGKVTPWGAAVLRQMRKHGWSISYEETSTSCKATVIKGTETHTETFTLDEAEKSGYTKDNYGKEKIGWKDGANRKLKLRYGALSALIKTYIPEVVSGYAGVAEFEIDVVSEPKDKKEAIKAAVQQYEQKVDETFEPQVEE